MHPTALILLTILAQASPSVGEAQEKAQAKSLLGQGTKLYEQNDFAGALEKFQAAYAVFPSPKLMFNIGEANRKLHRPVEALEAFERFLAGVTDAPEKVAEVRTTMSQLRKDSSASIARRRARKLVSTARAWG
jgi:tetratricopeptide (TPR) repeat protein